MYSVIVPFIPLSFCQLFLCYPNYYFCTVIILKFRIMINFNCNLKEVFEFLGEEVRRITREEIREALKDAKNEPQKMYTRIEACKVLHITQPILWRWERENRIKGQRVGRRVLFSTEEINRLIHEKGGQA